MRRLKFASALLMTMFLVSCGGGGGDIPAKIKYSSHASFGDSLSDVGSYDVGFIHDAGGQFSVNAPNGNGKAENGNDIINWTEVIAMNLGLPAPCAAWTGLDDGTAGLVQASIDQGIYVEPTGHDNSTEACTGYAQGGALVTIPYGIHNKHWGDYSAVSGLGGYELTYSVATQISKYLAAHPTGFTSNDLVSVVVGGNEVKLQLTLVGGGLATPTEAVTAMATAAGQLVNYVNTLILANGAEHVVVASIPDFASIPAVASYDLATKGLIDLMVTTFNTTLRDGLANLPGSANVAYVDLYASSKDEVANPSKYGLINVTDPACNNVGGRALFCNASTLLPGLTPDSHYMFADDTHPTPYGHALFAQAVLQAMTAKGWY